MFDRSRPVRAIMSENVITVGPDTVMSEVVALIKSNPVHHIPVVDNGKVLGMVSTTDCHMLEHHFTLFKTQSADAMNAAIFRSLLAKEVMTAPVATIRATDTVQIAADIFKENLFHALPVVDDHKKIVGIVTPYDLMVYAFGSEHLAELPQ
jgi:CBS-domain-containing membrane protein